MGNIKFIDDCLRGGPGPGKYRRFFDYMSMPRISVADSGTKDEIVDSIWSPYDHVDDESEWDEPLLYDRWTYKAYFHLHKNHESVRNVIHPEIRKLFGWHTIAGKRRFVRHISFRTDSSGHANPDNIATIYVGGTSISVYDIENATYYGNHSIYYDDPYFVDVCKTLLNKKFEVKHYNKPSPGTEEFKKPMTLKEASVY